MPDNALRLRDVHKSFGATAIIRGVSLEIPAGERHAIIGPNGAGKSTLFNLVSGRLAPSRGSIELNGDEIAGMRPFHIARRGLARSFQVTNIFPRLTVFENIRCALLWPLGHRYDFVHGVEGLRDVNDRAAQVLEQIGLTARRDSSAALTGAVLLLIADVATRLIHVGTEMKLGVLTSLIGTPFFFWLVVRLRKTAP